MHAAECFLSCLPPPSPAVICSDKTGTLTTNQMSAVQLAAFGTSLAQLTEWEVSGSTYDPDGGAVQGLTMLDRNLEVRARCMCGTHA